MAQAIPLNAKKRVKPTRRTRRILEVLRPAPKRAKKGRKRDQDKKGAGYYNGGRGATVD